MQPEHHSEQLISDVKDRDNMIVVEIEIPGYLREEIEACFNDGYLTVTARNPEQASASASFKKAVYIGKDVSQTHIRAAFHGGVLKCMIPKDGKSAKEAVTGPIRIDIM